MNKFYIFPKNKKKRENMKRKIICILLVMASLLTLLFNIKMTVSAEEFNFNAESYLLMDYNSKTILAKFNESERLEIASMVKLMTTLITIEKLESGELCLDQKVMASEYACSMEGSQAFLDAGEEYTIEELLKSVIIASANDSSVVLSEAIAGTEENFTALMNEKAKALGLKNTHYANSTGLPSENEQYSCAEDVAKLLCEEIKHELYFKFSNIWIDEIIHPSGRRTELVNTNVLIRQYKGVDIGKTGFTDEAGYCLSSSCQKNGMRLVSVVIGAKSAKDRFSITSNLLNYGFANFENRKILTVNDNVENKMNLNGKLKELELEFENDFYLLVKKGEKSQVNLKYEMNSNIKAPISKGQVLGKVYVVNEGVIVGEVNILAKNSISKPSYKDSFKRALDNFAI